LNDARTIAPTSQITGDLCIIGAGPSGITLAREFFRKGQKVILLESGGLEFDQKTQDLYQGKSVGLEYPLSESRLRYFGGSTNSWWGNCRPLDTIDFETGTGYLTAAGRSTKSTWNLSTRGRSRSSRLVNMRLSSGKARKTMSASPPSNSKAATLKQKFCSKPAIPVLKIFTVLRSRRRKT